VKERGSVTLWMLGLSVSLIMLGAVAFDLWRAIGQRRELAAIADAAAVAAASGIDVEAWRTEGVVRLDAAEATARALAAVELHAGDAELTTPPQVTVLPDRVTVRLQGWLSYGLLQLVVEGDGLGVAVSATAVPVAP